MSVKTICTLITAGGVVISAVISFLTSRYVSNKEIEKLKLTWKREDNIMSSEDISELTKLVYEFANCQNDYFRIPAMAKVAAMRSRETGAVADALNNLHNALEHCNRYEATKQLSEVIQKQGAAHCDTQNKQRKNPK